MTKEALKLALEALQNPWKAGPDGVADAITAIKEALAQPEQEPVAWIDEFGNVFPLGARRGPKHLNEPMKPLYTTPPQRKPLTGDEIWKFWCSRPEVPEGEDDSMEAEFVAAVRRVLAAHGIKE